MDLSQQSVLSLLIAEGGKVKRSDLVRTFRGSVDCDDPAEKERNKELFKNFVNNVAVVKEMEGVRYVVIRKKYEPLLHSFQAQGKCLEEAGNKEDVSPPGEQQSGDAGFSEPDPPPEETEGSSESQENPPEILSPIELALRRSRSDFRLKRMLNFEIQSQDTRGENCLRFGDVVKQPTCVQSKPYALPLRMPPTSTTVEIRKLKGDPDSHLDSPKLDDFKRKLPSVKREECKESRIPSVVPLDHTEHEWLVRCASGHWSQVYGLLLRDSQLAEKKDFMSGFTALHWAAKCGNSDMLVKIIFLSRKGGFDIDINAKTHGGYTPLHIAALHDQQYIMAMLVGEYGADPNIRDNCGKRAYHYLHKDTSQTLRDMLGEPKVQHQAQAALREKEDLDRELFPDLSKGLHSISRLFQPNITGQRKKHKQRPAIYSLSEDQGEEREDGNRCRLAADVFM